ncbi:MAG: DNA-3-methyladenine glycosylase [Ilumatobacteraceae bacterium]
MTDPSTPIRRDPGRLLDRSFYARDAPIVAPELLNKVFVVGRCAGRIVETEAYTRDDPASHSFKGPTLRTKSMFGPPGHLYVYFTYGMHFCANVVTGPEGDGQAVLIRALEPLWGIDEMEVRRGDTVKRTVDLTNGPGKLTRALGIGRDNDGDDLLTSRIRIYDDGTRAPLFPEQSERIGISSGLDRRWRFFVGGNPSVSRGPRPGSPDPTTP